MWWIKREQDTGSGRRRGDRGGFKQGKYGAARVNSNPATNEDSFGGRCVLYILVSGILDCVIL